MIRISFSKAGREILLWRKWVKTSHCHSDLATFNRALEAEISQLDQSINDSGYEHSSEHDAQKHLHFLHDRVNVYEDFAHAFDGKKTLAREQSAVMDLSLRALMNRLEPSALKEFRQTDSKPVLSDQFMKAAGIFRASLGLELTHPLRFYYYFGGRLCVMTR